MKRIFLLTLYFLLQLKDKSNAQNLSSQQLSFIKKNIKTISAGEINSEPDWSCVAPQIKGKKIVLLGEFNHGSKEVFILRNDLIRFLHEKMGFTAILFESGIGELALPELNKDQMNPGQMINGFFGGWRTNEFRNLMEYVKFNHISIGGFDIQRTGGSFKFLLRDVSNKKNVDSIFYVSLEDRYGVMQRDLTSSRAIYDSVQPKTAQLISDYQKVYDLLAETNVDKASKELLFSRRTILNRIGFLQYMLNFVKDKNWNERWAARDSAMADNIRWLIDNFYAKEKIVVVAHNFHIARYNQNEKVMGEMLSKHYGKDMYAIGVFAGGGSYSDNAMKEVKMKMPDSANLDIKHIIEKTEGFVNFLDKPRKKVKGAEWLDQNMVVSDTFIDLKNSDKMILSKHFDGLLFIKKVSPSSL